ncbi:MAG: class I SAM-dependent methyltransferase [Chloroflexota bacterium]
MTDNRLSKKIQEDFDRIAWAAQEEDTHPKWDHNNHYHNFLLKQLPTPCGTVLEVGCGIGEFAHRLGQHVAQVTAVDLSPKMVDVANQRLQHVGNIDFHVADIMTWTLPPEHFDAIVSIATLHHISLELLLPKLQAALKPGGRLVVLDLLQHAHPWDAASDLVAVPLNWLYEKRLNRGVTSSTEAAMAMQAHIETDQYLTLAEARQIYTSVLAGAKVRKHLFWRYSVVWEKS